MSISTSTGLQLLSDDDLDAVSGGRGSPGACVLNAAVEGGATAALGGVGGATLAGVGAVPGAVIGFFGGALHSIATNPDCFDGEQSATTAAGHALGNMVSSWFE